ncbi:MAG: DPP IV N-terminal domain-containing protein [Rhodopirellula sp.]|nr:DPP IV N-terminal domain-containing protein [Rhodopirellula sp.]
MHRQLTSIYLPLIVMLPAIAVAQGTLADYDRANSLRETTRNTVFRQKVEPNWTADGKRLWYRIEVAPGEFEFVIVNAIVGTRELAFDQQELAKQLADATKKSVIAERLPFQRLVLINDEDAIEFSAFSGVWKYDRGEKELTRLRDEEPSDQNGEKEGKKNPRRPQGRDAEKREIPEGRQSPDGKWIAFEHNHDLQIRSTSDPAAETITLGTSDTDGGWYSDRHISWSPDSRKLVALRTRQGQQHDVSVVESSPQDQLQPKLHTHNYLKPGDQIPQSTPHLFDVDTKKEIAVSDELFANPWMSPPPIEWSPNSGRFFFTYNQRGHQILRVIAVDAKTGEAQAIVDEQSDTFIDYAYKQFLQILHDSNELIWMSERDGWNHLYLYDLSSGEVRNQVTKGEWVVRKVERVDAERRQIWFQASGIYSEQDPYYIHHCRVNFDGSGLTYLTDGDGTHTVSWSPDRNFLVDTYSRVDQPPVTELRDAETGKLICELERADWSRLLETGWKVPERFVAKGRDNATDIYGVIYRPTNFDETKKYPVIEKIYAGPHGSFVPKAFSDYFSAQSMTELGFIVVQIDSMGTSNRSKAFHDVCAKNLGDSGFPDRIKWINAAANKYPFMDLSRGVGIYGGSAGGQSSTRAVLAFGDFYTVAVSDCGCHDNRMDKIWWNELWMGWPVGPHYEEQSNVTNAHRLTGKLFLTVGELDRNVDPASTMQVVNALIKADKDFDLLVVPGGGHGIGESPYGKRRRQDFFVRHLLGVEPRSR